MANVGLTSRRLSGHHLYRLSRQLRRVAARFHPTASARRRNQNISEHLQKQVASKVGHGESSPRSHFASSVLMVSLQILFLNKVCAVGLPVRKAPADWSVPAGRHSSEENCVGAVSALEILPRLQGPRRVRGIPVARESPISRQAQQGVADQSRALRGGSEGAWGTGLC